MHYPDPITTRRQPPQALPDLGGEGGEEKHLNKENTIFHSIHNPSTSLFPASYKDRMVTLLYLLDMANTTTNIYEIEWES